MMIYRSTIACFLLFSVVGAEPAQIALTWSDGDLVAGNAFITRRWHVQDGLPVPTSLVAFGREWLRPDGKPGMVPPGGAPTAPQRITWAEADDPGDPVEAPSRRGALTVLGADGRGYRWQVQVFTEAPVISCRLETLGGAAPSAPAPARETADSSGVEKDGQRPANGKAGAPDTDLMERLPLEPWHAELGVVGLQDRTDVHDNLAAERVWRLGAKETVGASTCLATIRDPLADAGLALLKHAPLPDLRPAQRSVDLIAGDRLVRLCGHGAAATGQGYAWSVAAWRGGPWERSAALHRLQACFRTFRPGRDGLLMSNTWGDRHRDSRINESFVLAEIAAGAALGVDVCQVDDGWQRGITANSALAAKGGVWSGFWAADPGFWTPHPQRFPEGLGRVAAAAQARGMGLGLWFAPDSAEDFRNWEQDAAVLTALHRTHGIRHVKIDGVKIRSRIGELRLQQFLARVRRDTGGELSLDYDITAEERSGYFGAIQAGPLFLENRYTDWRSWFPHATLRNLWQLSWYVPPQRLRIEFLNPERNPATYGADPLAPRHYPVDYPFATTLVANPLAWCEVSHLSPEVAGPITALAATWRHHRDELHLGTVLPIGECPSGGSWTGFCSRADRTAQVLVFRERTREGTRALELPLADGAWRVERLAGTGGATWSQGRLQVAIPEALHYLWLRLSLD